MSTNTLKQTIDWIDTLAENQDLTHEHKEVATVIARRKLDNDPDLLPKTLARTAIENARDHLHD